MTSHIREQTKLITAQLLSGAGIASGYAVGGLLAEEITGQTSMAGFAQMIVILGAGLIAYPHGTLWAGFAPPWLLALWVLFAIQVNVLFRWLRGRWWLALALGAVAGPLSFRAGAALGAAHISAMAATLGTLAIGWAIWMPLLVRMGEHSDGTGIPP